MFAVESLGLLVPVKPTGDRLYVLPLAKADRSIIVTTDEGREKPLWGVVVACGPGRTAESGTFVPVTAQVGQLILFPRYGGMDFELHSEPFGDIPVVILEDSFVMGTAEAGSFDLELHEDGDPRKLHLKGLTCQHCPVVKSAYLEEERARLLREQDGEANLNAVGGYASSLIVTE